ncbi:PREDICTED: uncharacterized protein LOC105557895 [Vollenhovia emeryi]|uniref:uncharacterized protein LOC105557895 n=1 Tax=Vollenhovia emeryi TaxID=411798 RepID=UPI0005F42C70|nr:PREDICTED: uncharacterized protein LOC105557895 [Vollenhovia emeryi]
MTCISLHTGLNKFMLLIVGLWPYQQSKLVQLQFILLYSILTSFILLQFTTLLTSHYTRDLLIKILGSALFYVTLAIKYSSFSVNIEIVKYLLERLQHICNELTDENEINIIKEYAVVAKRYTIMLLLLFILIMLILISYPIWLHIFDIFLSINETRLHFLPLLVTEHIIDHKKYFYLVLFYTHAAVFIGLFVMFATGTILIFYLQHACGMFRIVCYRITRVMTFKTLQKNKLQNENLIYKELICAVDMHRKAIKFSDSVVSRFKVMFSLLIMAGLICGSLNVFRIFQITSFEYDIDELLLRITFIIVHLSYMFIANYVAQEITDHNNHVFVSVYNSEWYVAPLQIQKMILFLLQKGTKAFTLNIAGLFVGSLEGAATITTFFTTEYTLQLAIEIFSFILLFVAFIIKYNSFWINIQIVKCLLEQLQHIYTTLKDENEIAIIEKYGRIGRRFTIRIMQLTLCGAFSLFSLPMWPRILDIIMPMNESRSPITMPIATEYFVDQDKYFYLILLHLNAALCIGAIAYIATGTMLVGYLKHACGMFKIASYRIERAMMINILGNSIENEITIYKAMIYAVDIHRQAIKFAEIVTTNFEGTFLFIIAVSVSCLSLNLFRILQSLAFGSRNIELLMHFSIAAIILVYVFIANYAGQEITDHNNHVFSTAYNVRWYTAPLSIQKLILFVLQRGSKSFGINIGGLFIVY